MTNNEGTWFIDSKSTNGIVSKDMATKTTRRTILGLFLIGGTLLALYLTIYEGYNLFGTHTAWLYRDGVMPKLYIVVAFADIALLSIAGLISTIYFFLKKLIWKSITKGIVINVTLWLMVAGLMFCLWPLDLIVRICGLLITGLFAWMMLRIWKMIK